VEQFSEVEDCVNLVFWQDLDELMEFFDRCHGACGDKLVCASIMAEETIA
jgi:hypothetical protein